MIRTENDRNLTDEELIARLRGGEASAMDLLMERYKRKVRNQARALYLIGGDSDDLIQEGMLGLFKAVRDYRPERENSFEHFASVCISRQLYSAIQASNRQKHAPLNSYVELSPELGESMGELREQNPEELLIARENISALREIIRRRLSSLERQVLDLYLEGRDYREIARLLKKSPKSVDNALQRIRRKASEELWSTE